MKQYFYACKVGSTENGEPLFLGSESEKPTRLLVASYLVRDPKAFKHILDSVPDACLYRVAADINEADYEAECRAVLLGYDIDQFAIRLFPGDKVKLSEIMMGSSVAKKVGSCLGTIISGGSDGWASEEIEPIIAVKWEEFSLTEQFCYHDLVLVERGKIFQDRISMKENTRKRWGHIRG